MITPTTRLALRPSRLSTRLFSSSPLGLSPVRLPLASEHFKAKAPTAGPVVVLHGLYGSKQNWRGLAKAMALQLGRDITTLDLRNHGESPHAPECGYADLAEDVAGYLEDNKLEDVTVVGHSMGGKVAMALALRPHPAVERLCVVDIAPAVGSISPEFREYLTAMKKIEAASVKSRKDADVILQEYEKDLGVRQFLLTNLERKDSSSPWRFRLPLDFLLPAIDEIGKFPYQPGERTFDRPTLFLKGTRSKYINKHNEPLIAQFFPQADLVELDTAHWVHAEKPKEFLDLLVKFCAK